MFSSNLNVFPFICVFNLKHSKTKSLDLQNCKIIFYPYLIGCLSIHLFSIMEILERIENEKQTQTFL